MPFRAAVPVACLLTCALILGACGAQPAAGPKPPPAVLAAVLVAEDVPVQGSFVGRTVANRSVGITARVTAILTERPYQEASLVPEGAVLFRLDPREFDADRSAARARIAQVQAQIAKTTSDLRRATELVQASAGTELQLDAARAADLDARAALEAAQAQLAIAELNCSYTTIAAPFAGRASRSAVDPGGLVGPSTGVLATLDQVDPIAIEFTVSEQQILENRRRIAAGEVTTPGLDHLEFSAQLLDGVAYPHIGRLSFADVRIRPETGTALVRAVFPNPEGRLVPGQFVRVAYAGMVRRNAILVPQAAVVQSPTGSSVFVVGADGIAEPRQLRLGPWMDGRWLVEAGLQPGERVVVEGVQRVMPGKPVQASAAPAAATLPAAPSATPPAAAR